MGTLANLLELVRDTSYEQIEEEAGRDVTIALAGNSQESRDRLHKALSRPMESLWTANPVRLIEMDEHPTAEGETGGLLLYALQQNSSIPAERREWLQQVAAAPKVAVIVVVLPRPVDQQAAKDRNLGKRLQALNSLRLRLVGTNEMGARQVPTGVAADGATFNNATVETRPTWEVELEELESNSNGQLEVVRLSDLSLTFLERELLPLIVQKLTGRELALAKRAPVFRNAVATHFINKTARSNVELVLMANLTSGLPFVGNLFSGGADFVLLTKNQFELSHRLAGIYGQQRSTQVELYLELLPIVAGAFLWRSLSRFISSKSPPILAALPKAVIAFIATLGVGKLSQLYYANGRRGPGELAAFSRNLFEQLTGQGRSKANGDVSDEPRRLKSS